MAPAVSVLIPIHDAAATLSAALASVRAQTFADFELLAVLNGCRDKSEAIARATAARDGRVRVEVMAAAGIVPALSRGLALARAPLVGRLDADDRMRPERLAQQVAALAAHPEWVACATGVHHDGPPGGMADYVAWLNTLDTPAAIRAARFIDAPIAHPTVMFRRRPILDAGGYRAGDFPEDHDLWLRLLAHGPVIGRVPEVLVDWGDHPGRLSRTDPRCAPDAIRHLKHTHLLNGPLAAGRRARIWGAGPYAKRHAHALVARGAAIDDLIDIDPRKIGGAVAGRPVVAADAVGPPDGRLVLVCVASRGARATIMARLEGRGYAPERDYLALQ